MGINLIQDEEFKRLIPPLTPDEFIRLEDDIVAHGCLSPLIVWNNILLDGYNRLEICTTHNIPFQVKSLLFENRDAAISWICTHQIGRRNLSEDNRRYILGKLFEVQKRINVKNPQGLNQYSKEKHAPIYETKYGLARDLGDKFHVAHSTIERYAQYSRAIDRMADVVPTIIPKIMTGEVHIGVKSMIRLAGLPEYEIEHVVSKIDQGNLGETGADAIIHAVAKEHASIPTISNPKPITVPSVKDVPAFDPDADVTSLTLTIPSWESSILRVKENANLVNVSVKAKMELRVAFISLIETINTMLEQMKEV